MGSSFCLPKQPCLIRFMGSTVPCSMVWRYVTQPKPSCPIHDVTALSPTFGCTTIQPFDGCAFRPSLISWGRTSSNAQWHAAREPSRGLVLIRMIGIFGMSSQLPEQEAKKVACLLETIGRRMDRDSYRRVLEEIQVNIAARLRAAG